MWLSIPGHRGSLGSGLSSFSSPVRYVLSARRIKTVRFPTLLFSYPATGAPHLISNKVHQALPPSAVTTSASVGPAPCRVMSGGNSCRAADSSLIYSQRRDRHLSI